MRIISLQIMVLVSSLLISQNNYIEKLPKTKSSIPMIFIKGGNFQMGSSKTEVGHFGDEGPRHEVQIDDFWIGSTYAVGRRYHNLGLLVKSLYFVKNLFA